MNFDVVIVCAGSSIRFGQNKIFAEVGNQTVLERCISAFYDNIKINKIILVYKKEDYDLIFSTIVSLDKSKFKFVLGGDCRSQSVVNGLKEVESEGVLIHDGARPFISPSLIDSVMNSVEKNGSGIPALPVVDSLRAINGKNIVGELNRESSVMVQTPQGFFTKEIIKAYELANGVPSTDESLLYSRYIRPATIVDGEESNTKITTYGSYLGMNANVGIGYDLHPLTYGRKFVLCGVELEYHLGPMAISDGDAGIHALIDAILSAIGESDIGHHFPENDPRCDGLDSAIMLSEVIELVKEQNKKISNASIILILDKPKLADYIPTMRVKLARLMDMPFEKVSISAKTTEKTNPDTVSAYASVVIL